MVDIVHRYTRAVLYHSDAAHTISQAARAALAAGADLTGADLTGADLTGADLTGADLTRADLTGADLRGADLRGADLRGADLRGADLTGADLRGADLRGANCLTAILPDVLRLAGSRHALICIDENSISIGCLRDTLTWWREHYASVGREEGYTAEQIEEYRLHIEYAAAWLAARKPAAKEAA